MLRRALGAVHLLHTRPGGAQGYAGGMTREEQTGPEQPSEVLISGLDTGPDAATRENLSPTERRARLEEHRRPEHEPEDEDG